MTISIEQLIKAPTSDELFEKALVVLERVKIPARRWRSGSVARSLLSAGCELGAQGAVVVADCVAGCFLLLARGKYLTAHAKDVYDVDRIPATFAAGKVTFTNAGGATRVISANQMVVRSSATKKKYVVRDAFTIPALGSVTVDAYAVESGSASSAAPEEIDELETTLSRVTVSNDKAFVGLDEELDDALVKRCILKRGTWSPFGPRDAYEHAALSATLEDGTPAGITRVWVSRQSSKGLVTVVCATASGTPTDEQLAAARAAVEAQARNDVAKVTVSGAVPKATAHVAIVWCRGGTEAIIRAKATKAINAFIAGYPIGGIAKTDGGTGYLYLDALEAAIVGANAETYDVDFVDGADIALASNEVVTNSTTLDVRIR